MAIEINGSGTITGISAGGLPDSCVTDADIAGMAASKLTGALPAIDGSALTGLSGGLFASYALVSDVQSSGSHGGSFSSGAWRTRTLNTEVFDPDGIVSLSSNQFTLQAGTYFISAMAPVQSVVNHQIKLRNVTDSSDALFGNAGYASQSSGNATDDNDYAFLKGRITISGAKAFELQHQCNTSRMGAGFGQPSTFGAETYASVEIYKET